MKGLTKVLLFSAFIAGLLSSYLLTVDHPAKYLFYPFQIILIVTIVALLFANGSSSRSDGTSIGESLHSPLQRSLLDLFFFTVSVTLLLINVFNIPSPATIFLAFIAFSLLPGYVLLRISGLFSSRSYLEGFVLSYALSFGLTGALSILFAPVMYQPNRLAILSTLVFLSAMPAMKDSVRRNQKSEQIEKSTRSPLASTLILTIVLIFFLLVTLSLYPRMAFLPGADIVQHFSGALSWGFEPDPQPSPYYLFFRIYQSAIYSVSTPSIGVHQTFFAFTSVSVILSFYIMAKAYLSKIDPRLPALSTIFWAMFSGLGWLYLFGEKAIRPSIPEVSLLHTSYDITYGDIGYGLTTNLWFWFLPMTVSFTIFFVLLYLVKCKNIPKATLELLIVVLVVTLYFVHVSELVMYVLLISGLSFIGQREELRLNEALFATFLGLAGLSIVTFISSFRSFISVYSVPLVLTIIVGLVYFASLWGWKGASSGSRSLIMRVFAYASMFFFIAGLISWVQLGPSFSMAQVGTMFVVPWFFYPVRLGFVGFLGLLGIVIVAEKYRENGVAVFPFLFLFAIVVGRLISFVNVNLFYTGYWEWRFLFFSFAAASVVSPLLLKQLAGQPVRNRSKTSPKRMFVCAFLVSIIVIGGASSTFLTVTKWNYVVADGDPLEQEELDALSFLQSTFFAKGTSVPLLTATYRSALALEFVTAPWVERSIQPVIWSPRYPEVPLAFVYNMRFAPPYVFLHQRDLDAIDKTDSERGYLFSIFLQGMSEEYANSRVGIYEVPYGVPPVTNGRSILVFPHEDVSRSDLFASYVLSLAGANYTTMLDSDPMIPEKDTLIFPTDSLRTSNLSRLGLSGEKKIIVINLDGYGPLSRQFLESQENQVTVRVKSGTGVFVYSLANGTVGLNSISERLFDGNIEFIIQNGEEKINYVSIVDDNQTTFWTGMGGISAGEISTPKLTNDASPRVGGIDSLEVLVEDGDYEDWFIQHVYNTTQDWSTRQFMTMWWHGANSGQTIQVLAGKADWSGHFQYSFVDDVVGWKHIVIPLKGFTPYGEPRWNAIEVLQIRSLQGGVRGSWHLDSIGLEDSNSFTVESIVYNATAGLPRLFIFNGLNRVSIPLPDFNSTVKIPANSFWLLDGSSAEGLFNEEYVGEVRLERIGNTDNITISARIPVANSCLSQLRFGIEYESGKMNATSVITPSGRMSLPMEIPVGSLTSMGGGSVLAWYSNESMSVPLAIMRRFVDQVDVIYFNIYPIFNVAYASRGATQNLVQTIAELLGIFQLPEYDGSITSWVIEDDTPVFAFASGFLTGNVSIEAMSALPSNELDLSEVVVSMNGSYVSFKDVISLSLQNASGNITLSSASARIGLGRGFYVFTAVDNPHIEVRGDKISISVVTSNNTRVVMEGSAVAQLSINGTLFTYLRDSRFVCIGTSSFQSAFALHSYLGQLQTLGQVLHIYGQVRFSLPLSDWYSVASDFTWNGVALREPPSYSWDELGSIIKSVQNFVWAIILSSIVWVSARSVQHGKAHKSESKQTKQAKSGRSRERLDPLAGDVNRVQVLLHIQRYEYASRNTRGMVLDVGCGLGYGSCILNRIHGTVVAFDISDRAVLYAIRNYPGPDYLRADAGVLPFKDQCFESVVALEVIEHVDSGIRLLDEIHRVSKNKGSLILSSPNLAHLANRLRYALFKRYMLAEGSVNPYHKREYTSNESATLLELSGFAIQEKRGQILTFPFVDRLPPRLCVNTGRFAPDLSLHIIYKTEKRAKMVLPPSRSSAAH